MRSRGIAAHGAEILFILDMTILVESILDRSTPLAARLERDEVVLDWEERRKSRQRTTTRRGRAIAIALPTGTVIRDGDILYAGETFYIIVEAKEEDLMVISPKSINEAARIAFELGNRHLPVSIQGDAIMTPCSRDTESAMEGLGVPYERKTGIFEPVRRAGHHVHG